MKKKRFAYKSKHNFKHGNQVVLLMITDGKKWHSYYEKTVSITKRRSIKFLWRLLLFKFIQLLIHKAQRKKLKNMKEYAMIMIIVM